MEIILNLLWLIFNNLFISFFTVFCWYKCINKAINLKKTILLTLCISLFTSVAHLSFSNAIRIISVFIFLILLCNFFVTHNYKKSAILVIISEFVAWLGEFLFVIIITFFNSNEIENVLKTPLVYFALTLYICLFFTLLINKRVPQKVFSFMDNNYLYSDNGDTLKYSFIIIAIIIISTIESYMNLPLTVVLITNVIMAIIFIGLVVMSSKIKANYNKINSKYETSISSLKEYEVMIDKFRVDTHENKNEFLTIRNMLKDKNSKETVIKYVDKIIDNKIKDNDKIMKKTSKIPEGGLRATIYSKLCLMDKLKIKYKLNISREVRTTDLINLDEDLILKICKILGVFLDNAIEAVKKLKKKEISIEIYILDEKLCIDITNNFEGNLDLDKINNIKYTTKGEGHGYGLTLVKQLLDESNKLENEKSINRDTFTQTLKIKM